MKKINLFFMKSLLMAFACVMFAGCDESSLELPYYPLAQVSMCERDSVKTLMTYGGQGVSEYSLLEHGSLICTANVRYSASNIHCTIKGISYDIKLANTKGACRVEEVLAKINGAQLYRVLYFYDESGRLKQASIEGVSTQQVYTHYTYEGNTIIIDDVGIEYKIELSSEDNTGNVCNVLDYADAPYTSNYVINPDLYFLNIYGTPVSKLPRGHEVAFNKEKLSRVGKYYYEYCD
ncbi:MAG: hypothetical protein LBV74_05775 [Tannerella sp.]|jgi:hypothetical protein|nr:hypothetical protein [Tannerella sp.]